MLVQSFVVSSLLLAASVIAQSPLESSTASATIARPTNSAESTASGESMVSIQVVRVGDGSLKFEPEQIEAPAGSMVQFHFYKKHTLTQSTFNEPCQPIQQIMSNVTGINTGPLTPEASTATPLVLPVFTILINDTNPLWMYCAVPDHCAKGMAMVINPPATGDKTLAAYKALAASASSGNATARNQSESTAQPLEGSASPVVSSIPMMTGLAAVLIFAFALSL